MTMIVDEANNLNERATIAHLSGDGETLAIMVDALATGTGSTKKPHNRFDSPKVGTLSFTGRGVLRTTP